MEKYIVFSGILRVYQQFSREKIKPERQSFRDARREKNPQQCLTWKRKLCKSIKKISPVIKKEL